MNKKEVVEYFLKKGCLICEEIFTDSLALEQFKQENALMPQDLKILGDYFASIENIFIAPMLQTQKIQPLQNSPPTEGEGADNNSLNPSVKIIFSYDDESKKRSSEDFISYFRMRFKALRGMLEQRPELQNVVSIQKLHAKKERETVSLIAMISDMQKTKNNNIILIAEDITSQMKCMISKDNNAMLEAAKELVLDEVVGITGFLNHDMVYVSNIIWPDVPLSKELKKAPDEAYAAFIGDTEFGNRFFLKEQFEAFLQWIKGETGSDEQKRISQNLKYLFIVGDLVDGVGVYPGQENDLIERDIYRQYEMLAEYLKQIPQRITIIACPGNHDAMRIAEPQPRLYEDLAGPVYKLPNLILVSNPSIVNIHSSEIFPGFDVLMYHGSSFPYYADNVEAIRTAGGLERVDLIMKLLLKKRHLAPTHTSTLYLPTAACDNLVISKVPDFFITGHIHQCSATIYRNVTMLNCSCWLSQTPYQEKRGINPKPARVLVANLQTREIKVMKF